MIRQEGMGWSVIQIAVLVAVTGFIFKSFRRLVCSAAHFSKVARLRSSRHPGQAAEPLQVVLFEGEGVGEATGREVDGGPCGAWPFRAQALRRSPACRGLRASACALPAACKFHSPATRLAFPGSAPLINLFGLTRAE